MKSESDIEEDNVIYDSSVNAEENRRKFSCNTQLCCEADCLSVVFTEM